MDTWHDEVGKQVDESISLIGHLRDKAESLVAIADVIVEALKNGRKVILFGNGGSAADAQHIAAELSGRFYINRDPLPAVAVVSNVCSLTAIANDYGYEEVFSRQVRGLAGAGDVVIGISTSGNSPNVIRGLAEARNLKAVTVAFTGEGGEINQVADLVLSLPSQETPRIQEAHTVAGHIICSLVEEALFGVRNE